MPVFKFICFFTFCFLLACRDATSVSPLEAPKPPVLLLSHDLSKTYLQPPPTAAQLREWAGYVAGEGGCIAFSLIGSPDSVGGLVRKTFLALPRLLKNPTYYDQLLLRQARDSIQPVNARLVTEFVGEALALLHRYPPQQHTDLNGRYRDARIFFEEPGMERYRPFYFLASDGLQDVHISGLPADRILQPGLLPPGITVLTCGWKNPLHPAGWIRLGEPQSLIPALKSLTFK